MEARALGAARPRHSPSRAHRRRPARSRACASCATIPGPPTGSPGRAEVLAGAVRVRQLPARTPRGWRVAVPYNVTAQLAGFRATRRAHDRVAVERWQPETPPLALRGALGRAAFRAAPALRSRARGHELAPLVLRPPSRHPPSPPGVRARDGARLGVVLEGRKPTGHPAGRGTGEGLAASGAEGRVHAGGRFVGQ
jgi:hypothetical protein